MVNERRLRLSRFLCLKAKVIVSAFPAPGGPGGVPRVAVHADHLVKKPSISFLESCHISPLRLETGKEYKNVGHVFCRLTATLELIPDDHQVGQERLELDPLRSNLRLCGTRSPGLVDQHDLVIIWYAQVEERTVDLLDDVLAAQSVGEQDSSSLLRAPTKSPARAVSIMASTSSGRAFPVVW